MQKKIFYLLFVFFGENKYGREDLLRNKDVAMRFEEDEENYEER